MTKEKINQTENLLATDANTNVVFLHIAIHVTPRYYKKRSTI